MVAKTNFDGDYLFKVNQKKGKAVICVEAIRKGESGQKENYGYRTCGQTKTLTLKGDTINVERFYLNSRTIIDYGPQEVLFKFNSLTTVRDKRAVPFTDLPADSAITSIITLLNDNPTIILQISGHCDSREINPEILSEERARLVADMLVKKGIPKERLSYKGFGNEQLLVSKEEIDQAKASEKESLHQLNRRVSFSVVSFDYKKGN